jgi:hypothetical protein
MLPQPNPLYIHRPCLQLSECWRNTSSTDIGYPPGALRAPVCLPSPPSRPEKRLSCSRRCCRQQGTAFEGRVLYHILLSTYQTPRRTGCAWMGWDGMGVRPSTIWTVPEAFSVTPRLRSWRIRVWQATTRWAQGRRPPLTLYEKTQ